MKKTVFIVCLIVLANLQVSAQTWLEKMGNRIKDKAVEKVEQRIENKAEEATDKTLDKSE